MIAGSSGGGTTKRKSSGGGSPDFMSNMLGLNSGGGLPAAPTAPQSNSNVVQHNTPTPYHGEQDHATQFGSAPGDAAKVPFGFAFLGDKYSPVKEPGLIGNTPTTGNNDPRLAAIEASLAQQPQQVHMAQPVMQKIPQTAVPQAKDYSKQIEAMLASEPTLHMPSQDYNSYLQGALKNSGIAGIDSAFNNVYSRLNTDRGVADNNIGAAYGQVPAETAAVNAALQQATNAGVGSNNAEQAAMSGQLSGAYNSALGTAAAQEKALGTGSLAGETNSNALGQELAQQGALQAGAQSSNAQLQANNQANQQSNDANNNIATASKALAQQGVDTGVADSKASLGVQQSAQDVQARQFAAQLAATQQQNASQNAIGEFNAQLGGWGQGLGALQNQQQYGLQEQGLGLQQQQFQAGIIAAENTAAQNSYGQLQGILGQLAKNPNPGPSQSAISQQLANYYQQYSPTNPSNYYGTPAGSINTQALLNAFPSMSPFVLQAPQH